MTTTAPTAVSASIASIAATISATIGAVRVLRSAGLLRVRVRDAVGDVGEYADRGRETECPWGTLWHGRRG